MRKKKQQESTDEGAFSANPLSPRLTPADVQQKEFRLAFRGYNERDVDAFLDHVTEEIGAYLEETRRLREQVATAVTSVPGVPSEGEAPSGEPSEEAEEVLARAREEAARIVAEARAQAEAIAATSASAGTAPPDARAAIAPFLSRERDFLQNLGRLVQGHAEDIRGMVQASRDGRAAEAVPAAERPQAPEEDESSAPRGPITVPEAEPEGGPPSSEPAATSVGVAAEPAREEDGDPERPRSLRELFWEED